MPGGLPRRAREGLRGATISGAAAELDFLSKAEGPFFAARSSGFASVETIKKFRLIDVLLTAEDEELTPTMKLKRSFVSKKYSTLIDSMYNE